ncbi:MAG: alpha/beta fold hydrolase [Acidimicrobiales bacterium]|nr:alpha/beta fold hydrolase [Acidimicrobiales bacterium]
MGKDATGHDRATGGLGWDLEHVSIHGHDVAYRRAGHGPAVLLVHGIAGSSRTWEQVFPLLARSHTVVAPDLTGHGESAKPSSDYSLGAQASGLRDLLTILEIERATVVGQSFGGGVAMQLAYQYPEHCERLVLVGSGGLGREVSWLLRLLAVPGVELVLPVIFPPFVPKWGDKVVEFLERRNIRWPRGVEMWRAYSSLTTQENRNAFVRTVRGVIDPGGQSVSAIDRLYLAARMPTLIIWGDQDRIIPVSHAYAAHEAIEGSRLEIMEGAGHFPHVEEPVRFAEVLTEFIRSTKPNSLAPDELRKLMLDHDAPRRPVGPTPAPSLPE